jgi:hypothetical protein
MVRPVRDTSKRFHSTRLACLTAILGLATSAVAPTLASAPGAAQQPSSSQAGSSQSASSQSGASSSAEAAASQSEAKNDAALPRGKKLMLKDGNFQLVRDYTIVGDRVRYYSLDRSQWEEIPAALVDWDKTKQVNAEQAKKDEALLTKIHTQEQARIVQPLDIDASLEAAPGVFLPPGEGMFAFDGKAVLPVAPAEPSYKTDRKRQIEKVLSPIPIVPSRHAVLIQGARSKVRVRTGQPEFYMRTKEENDPELELVPAKVHGDARQIANIDELFRMQGAAMKPLLMQRWQVAKGVYRFTLGQTLTSGEYALIEVVEGKTDLEQLSVYVWDFGVDVPSAPAYKAN